MENFKLSQNFINKFKRRKAPFGFNGLGELVYMSTYSRIKENGKNERWWETVQRVVEGTYTMQKNWIESHQLGWNAWQAQKSAQDMYERIFTMKFLPPGRGLWAMGTAITEERGLYAALNNCAFVSTKTLKEDYSKPFCFLMDAIYVFRPPVYIRLNTSLRQLRFYDTHYFLNVFFSFPSFSI